MPAILQSVPSGIVQLQAQITPAADHRLLPFGIAELDRHIGGGLRAGALHEATPASCALVDDAAATLFLAGIAAREARKGRCPGALGELPHRPLRAGSRAGRSRPRPT